MIIEEKQNRIAIAMCERLKEKRIFLCGQDVWTKELVKNSLDYFNSKHVLKMQILDGKESEIVPGKGDLVIVIGEIQGAGSECLDQLDVLMTEMEQIQKAETEAVVYISDSRVYGKSFGPQVSRKEDELGYVCHTSMEETDRQCMRMAEHLVCRMAKEGQMPVKVVRLDHKPDAEELYVMMPYILGVLLNGIPGEVYNVTAAVEEEMQSEILQQLSWKENRSPLTAMEIRMNTEKVRNYVASELFE